MGLGSWGQALSVHSCGLDRMRFGKGLHSPSAAWLQGQGFLIQHHHETVGSAIGPRVARTAEAPARPLQPLCPRLDLEILLEDCEEDRGLYAMSPSPSIQAPPWHCQPALYNLPLGSMC